MTSHSDTFVSVVMPVYNAGDFLHKSIESILGQSYTDFEFIIINDGSTDGSWEVIESYAKKDDRIVAVNQKNSGVVKTANLAASMARGKYLARTDADDISFESKLEDLVACAKKYPSAIVIAGSVEIIDENDEFLYRALVPIYDGDIKRALYIRNAIPNGATLIKKEAFDRVGGFADVFAEDCHLWTRLFSEGDFRGTGTTVYRWRTNSTGLTLANYEKSMQKQKEYLSKLWDDFPPRNILRSEILARSHIYAGMPGRFGSNYNEMFLHDISQVAVHQIKHGYIWSGSLQLLSIASTGVLGIKIVLRRLWFIVRGTKGRVANSIGKLVPFVGEFQ
jgi:glycosyltransferase involved in cell wall biosynthesis